MASLADRIGTSPAGRNRYGLTLEIELTHPLSGDSAKAAADLAAQDVQKLLKDLDWGYGVARIECVYAPTRQFEHGDFVGDANDG